MAVKNAIFLFEVVVESVKSFVESRFLIIRSDFADIFSLELKDPKQMHIVMPEPLPLPPEPVGKKGKKKKPKPKKGKKGKKGKVEEPPPEPIIQSGQSVLFTTSAEFLIQSMNKCPMEVSLWSKEDNLVFIGASVVPWDPVFILYLEKIAECIVPPPPLVRDEYNVFQEGTAKLMARLGIQVKLTYLTDKIVSCFRTLTEDPVIKKVLYTGMNSKTTSYMCTLKTTDEEYQEKLKKIATSFVKDKPIPTGKPVVFASYTNAPAANVVNLDEDDYCCKGNADKPPDSKYHAPETCPDIDFICDYVRKIISSCNDNMRMMTPRPTIRPRVKATDIDRLCYCRETSWPQGKFVERFRKEAIGVGCPLCVDAAKAIDKLRENTFDVANIRGPCGKPDCKIARDLRAYIQNLIAEDNIEFNIDDIIGPCGSKSCTLVEKVQDFLRHEGEFKHGATEEGLSTQCACLQQMQNALLRRQSCESICSKECSETGSEASRCDGKGCPYRKPLESTQVYNVYYFTVEYDNTPNRSPVTTSKSSIRSEPSRPQSPQQPSQRQSPQQSSRPQSPQHPGVIQASQISSQALASHNLGSPLKKFKFCSDDCPMNKDSKVTCSKSVCTPFPGKLKLKLDCVNPVCPSKETLNASPADSDIIIPFDDILNPCCVKTCDIAEKVKDFIAEGEMKKKTQPSLLLKDEDPCYCDCSCNFQFTSQTTYCGVCGGYECLGEDVKQQPDYAKPHPCPVYHKLYDKQKIVVKSPWPDQDMDKQQQAADAQSMKSSRTVGSRTITTGRGLSTKASVKGFTDKAVEKLKKKKIKKKVGKTAETEEVTGSPQGADKKVEPKHYHPAPVPKHMGWLWTAEDIPGMKPRPKWKPGAANKILVRRYRTVREGVDNIAKKKRAMMQRKKKIEMKPTLVVKKEDGEYTVQMEVFKKYSKERMLFQYPYEEKQPLVYTIGKTEEEKIKIQRQRERRERRETRRKSRLLQSTFRDKCQEICLKAYNQAMGILPLPNPNSPECPCDVDSVITPSPPIDSCSCSDSVSISTSDTDNDEWIIEFTPPLARWDPKAKHPPVLVENESQYTYLDYRVKLLDKQGNPVARFFKGPDGKQECSDLGGFWGPGHQWQEINKDGYVGPDGRWVPLNFTGPDGMAYTSEEGCFTDHQGKVWRIGIDGYIDKDGKWAWYSRRRAEKGTRSMSTLTATTDTKRNKPKKTEATKGDAAKGEKADIKGKAHSTAAVHVTDTKGKVDKKNAAAQGGAGPSKEKKVQLLGVKGKGNVVMNLALNYDGRRIPYTPSRVRSKTNYNFRNSEAQKLGRYREIMNELVMFDELCDSKPPMKMNRASNTPRRKISPFTMDNFSRNMRMLPVVQSVSTHNDASTTATDTKSEIPCI